MNITKSLWWLVLLNLHPSAFGVCSTNLNLKSKDVDFFFFQMPGVSTFQLFFSRILLIRSISNRQHDTVNIPPEVTIARMLD